MVREFPLLSYQLIEFCYFSVQPVQLDSQIESRLFCLGRQGCGGLLGGNSFGVNLILRPEPLFGRNINNVVAHNAKCRAISDLSFLDWATPSRKARALSTTVTGELI
jgi:hypothetical protein